MKTLMVLLVFMLAACSERSKPREVIPTDKGDKKEMPAGEDEKRAPSYEYRTEVYEGSKVHILKIDPSRHRLEIIRGKELQYPSVLSENMIGAINAGFFKGDGKPAGLLKISGELIGQPAMHRGIMGWKDTSFYFGRFEGSLPEWLSSTEFAIGGAPLLIKEGKKLDPKPEKTLESFLLSKYARTAICKSLESIFLIVVEGGDRMSSMLGLQQGLTISELSDFLLRLGCENALNLDGGRSSTMIFKGEKVNKGPIFFGERKVSDIIIFR